MKTNSFLGTGGQSNPFLANQWMPPAAPLTSARLLLPQSTPSQEAPKSTFDLRLEQKPKRQEQPSAEQTAILDLLSAPASPSQPSSMTFPDYVAMQKSTNQHPAVIVLSGVLALIQDVVNSQKK
jgi:hypothetical protein